MTMRSPGSVLPLFVKTPSGSAALGAVLSGSAAALTPHERTASARNLFGTPKDADELYQGYGAARQQATYDMMQRLAVHMMEVPWVFESGAEAHNPDIPSGYTYLAQLAAHDLVSNIAPLPRPNDLASHFARDYRAGRLILDTIYGGGPLANPLPYAVAGSYRQRYYLRLGYGPLTEDEVRAKDSVDKERQPPRTDLPARDIGRVACPYLADPPGRGAPDALLADPRNDDHLIIAQLTALFHEFHNIVYAKLAPKYNTTDNDFAAYRCFLAARKVVTVIYRRIIVQDLLRRLLEHGVYARYADAATRYPDDFIDKHDDCRVPVEFSHAAYRFGHVMVRFSYTLNDKRPNGSVPETSGIDEILDRSSSRRADKLPLACTWLVDWSRFFELGDGKPLNLSRRIVPYVAGGTLPSQSYFPMDEEDQARACPDKQNQSQGGLFMRDLVRGADAGLRTVDSLIANLPPADVARSKLLRCSDYRQQVIRDWLARPSKATFSADDLDAISQNPPLFFFVLFEAAQCHDGKRLGILGSTILAEVFFAAYKKTTALLENDIPELQPVFGNEGPADMPSLIRFIKAENGLQETKCTAL